MFSSDEPIHDGNWWHIVRRAYEFPYYYNWSAGKVDRPTYGRFMFFQYCVIILLGTMASYQNPWTQVVFGLIGALIFLPTITMLGRRLKTLHRSPWIILPVFVLPYVMFYIILYLLLFIFLFSTLAEQEPTALLGMGIFAGILISFIPFLVVGALNDKDDTGDSK